METLARWDMMNAACPTRQVLDRVADKWTMLVIVALEGGTLRFSELRRSIDGITQKMLTQTLRALERDGMVEREVIPTVPVTVRYTLTPLGRSLARAVDGVRRWAYANMDAITDARDAYEAPRPGA
jgi:DNA-binding HxlR family transcriptional regulator